jgi:hypothetical protein
MPEHQEVTPLPCIIVTVTKGEGPLNGVQGIAAPPVGRYLFPVTEQAAAPGCSAVNFEIKQALSPDPGRYQQKNKRNIFYKREKMVNFAD